MPLSEIGGSDGNRTHVRKHFRWSISERRLCFKNSLQRTPTVRLPYRLSRSSPALPGIHAEFSCISYAGYLSLQVGPDRQMPA